MTRKRFIKLLMSRGYSRNLARKFALVVIEDTEQCGKWNKDKKQCGRVARIEPMQYTWTYRYILMKKPDGRGRNL